jgi:pyruvate,orthophosphate dikinase
MKIADDRRRLRVRANADTPDQSSNARERGAEGIGLCRTEHMFLGTERVAAVQQMIFAESDDEEKAAFDVLLPLQRGDFVGIFRAMDGLPVTVRLLDPPLHEFLPDLTELSVKIALDGDSASDKDKALLAAVRRLHEQNPMLGLRGVRLGLVIPGLFDMQVRAIAHAAAELKQAGKDPRPEVMIPLTATVQEMEISREHAEKVLEAVEAETGTHVHTMIGTMIDVPRVLLLRHERPDADDLGILPGRRGGRVLQPVHRAGHLRRVAVRDDRPRRRRPPGRHRRAGRQAGQAGHRARRLR